MPDNFFGSMTNFDGNVGEGMFAHDPMIAPPVGEIPWQGYTVNTPNGRAYQYQPQNLPVGAPGFIQNNEPTWVWGYVVMTFIIFSIAVAVVRNLYRTHAAKSNIKKAIKKRFKKVFGDDQGNVDNSAFINNDGENNYTGPNEEAKVPSSDERDPKGSVKDYFKKGVGKMMSGFGKQDGYEEMGGPEGDKDQYNG